MNTSGTKGYFYGRKSILCLYASVKFNNQPMLLNMVVRAGVSQSLLYRWVNKVTKAHIRNAKFSGKTGYVKNILKTEFYAGHGGSCL